MIRNGWIALGERSHWRQADGCLAKAVGYPARTLVMLPGQHPIRLDIDPETALDEIDKRWPPQETEDHRWMRIALTEARKATGTTDPNPAVGACIIADGQLISSGYTEPPPGRHAEIVAIEAAAGVDLTGATMYSTLEPCCHHGRTPPCTDAILASGVSRVVVGCVDPNPVVGGRGLEILRQAGLTVTLGVMQPECERQIKVFAARCREKLTKMALGAQLATPS